MEDVRSFYGNTLINTCRSAHYEQDDEYGDVIMVNESEWKKFIEKYEKEKTKETRLLKTRENAHYEQDDEYGDIIMVNESEWKKNY